MKNFLNSIRILSVAAVLSVGVSYVFAFNEPSTNPPTNTATPIHTGEAVQEKKGGIWSKKVLASPISIFKKSIFLPGNKSALRIGSNDNADGNQTFTKGSAGAITQDLNTALFGEGDTVPLVIDLYSRPQPQDAINFITELSCPIVTRFTNDKAAAFEFKKENDTRANIIARQVKLTGGDPDTNDVLVGDANGNARWAKASVVNGQVVFSPGTSPVPAGQCEVPYIPPSCPTGQSRDSDGYCKCDNSGLDPIAPPTYPTNRGVQTYSCTATGTCTAGIKFQSPPFLLKKLRNANGTPASMPNKCVIATKPVNVCPDPDTLGGDEIYTDSAGNSYPIYSGTGSTAGKYEVLTGLGETCTESTSAVQNGAPYNNYQVSVFP